ncbi:MAG: peptide deformylase [Candidatus Berkiella sp.]
MAMLKILQYPDPRLKRIAIRVEDFGSSLQKVIDDMFETHYGTADCAALAATQLDLNPAWAITVIDYSANKDNPLCLVNPEIVEYSGEQHENEGCMSVFPRHVHEKVKRAERVLVRAQDRYGKAIEIQAEGYFAKCLQHEIDHLNGFTYLDRVPKLKKDRLLNKIKKAKRLEKNTIPKSDL